MSKLKIQSTAYPDYICSTVDEFKANIKWELTKVRLHIMFQEKLLELKQSIHKCKQLKSK